MAIKIMYDFNLEGICFPSLTSFHSLESGAIYFVTVIFMIIAFTSALKEESVINPIAYGIGAQIIVSIDHASVDPYF